MGWVGGEVARVGLEEREYVWMGREIWCRHGERGERWVIMVNI